MTANYGSGSTQVRVTPTLGSLLWSWRIPYRQRDILNLDKSRLHTEYLLSDNFLDDVNFMLDVMSDHSGPEIKHIAESFVRDPNNHFRRISWKKDPMHGGWSVALENQNLDGYQQSMQNATRSCDQRILPGTSSATKDLAEHCQTFGCDEKCPRQLTVEEKEAIFERVRERERLERAEREKENFTGQPSATLQRMKDRTNMPAPPVPLRRLPGETAHGPRSGSSSSESDSSMSS